VTPVLSSTMPIHKAALAIVIALGLACSGSKEPAPVPEPTPKTLTLQKIGSYDGAALGAAEITAYDAGTKRLFVVNGANGTVDVLNLANPASPAKVGSLDVSGIGASVNSVAVHEGLVALAIQAAVKTDPGFVAFYRTSDLGFLHQVQVGSLPDMLTFTPDGTRLLVANEGEPNSYGQADSVDPEGSVSIITVNRTGTSTVATADFKSFIGQESQLRAQGIRIFGPGANAAQDLEPEYIAISPDGMTAYVTLQENNALAVVNIATAQVTGLKSFGLKDYSLAGFGLDASDEDGGTNTNSGTAAIKIGVQPVQGMYQPDAIASYAVGGVTYLVTANEGDARDYTGFSEEVRVRAYYAAGLDPGTFADAANLVFDSNLGRLKVTSTPNGGSTGKNTDGLGTGIFAFGGRSFSIWKTDGTRVFDSGEDFEQRTKALDNVLFNASNDNNNLDARSTAKGPEPEGVVLDTFGSKTYAFIGLERVGGVMVYDVSAPAAPVYVTYLNLRSGETGDRGPEGLTLIKGDRSPNGKPLLVVGNEISGTTSILQIDLTY
jgi:DNA-binding beta-propeller fold protein YncE